MTTSSIHPSKLSAVGTYCLLLLLLNVLDITMWLLLVVILQSSHVQFFSLL